MSTDRIWTLLARKLAGETSPEELGELEFLLKKNPDSHLKIQALTESWNEKDDLPEEGTENAYNNLIHNLKQQGHITSIEEPDQLPEEDITGRKSFRFLRLTLAIAFIIFAGFAIFSWVKNKKNTSASTLAISPINTISTRYGSRTKVQLPDGSTVWLNAGSKLTYEKDFGNKLREVNLIGEGFFDVVHNGEKPFIIHTPYFDIKDLGTQFNVKCYPDDKTTETSLVEGSVEITLKKRSNDKWILKPDEKLVLLNEDSPDQIMKQVSAINSVHTPKEPIVAIKKLTYLPEDSFSVETAWTYNKLSFEDEAFSEVAKKMERWYDCEFEFRTKKLEDIHMNGSFISETLEQAMDALKYTNRFSYEKKDRKVIIY